MTDMPNICVDFDGVLNTYDGWQGEDELFKPRPDVDVFLKTLCSKYNIIIFSTRDSNKILEWLQKYNLAKYVAAVTSIKVGAVAYIDDRAIHFNGDYNEVIDKLVDFKTHWEKVRVDDIIGLVHTDEPTNSVDLKKELYK